MIPMLLNSDKDIFMIGSKEVVDQMPTVPVKEPFSDDVIAF